MWTACGPSEELPYGGLALTDTRERSFSLGWTVTDETLALSEVLGAVFNPGDELVLLYRSKSGIAVAIADAEGWQRQPELVLEAHATPLGMAWLDDHLELVLDAGAEGLFIVRVPRAPEAQPAAEQLDRERICAPFDTCSLLGAYRDNERGWRFAVWGMHRTDPADQRAAKEPASFWDVGLDGGDPEVRTGLSADEPVLKRYRVGVIDKDLGTGGVVLQPDGRWTEPEVSPQGDGWSEYPCGHYRREGAGLTRYRVWNSPHDEGVVVHRLADQRIFLYSEDRMEGLPLIHMRINMGMDVVVASYRSRDAQALQYGHFLPTDEGWLLLGGGPSYLSFDQDLQLVEPRDVFTYLHQVDAVNVYGVYWVLFGQLLCWILCVLVAVLIARGRKLSPPGKRAAVLLGLAVGASIHGVVSIWWLSADIWQWLC